MIKKLLALVVIILIATAVAVAGQPSSEGSDRSDAPGRATTSTRPRPSGASTARGPAPFIGPGTQAPNAASASAMPSAVSRSPATTRVVARAW